MMVFIVIEAIENCMFDILWNLMLVICKIEEESLPTLFVVLILIVHDEYLFKKNIDLVRCLK